MNTSENRFNIGLVVGNIEDDFSNSICKGAMQAAEDLDMNLFILPAKYLVSSNQQDEDPRLRYEYQYNVLISYARLHSLDAVLILLSSIAIKTTHEKALEVLAQFDDIPIILLASEEPGYPSIMFNNETGLKTGVEAILAKGATKIGMIAGNPSNLDARERFLTVKNTLSDHDITLSDNRIMYGDYSPQCYSNIENWLDQNQDMEAIICMSDFIAKSVYKILKDRNYTIGKDILVLGYDDINEAAHMEPPLATIKADPIMIGYRGMQESMQMLKAWDAQEAITPKHILVDTIYIERESVSGKSPETSTDFINTQFYYKKKYEKVLDINHQMNIVNRDMLMFDMDGSNRYQELLEAFSIEAIPSCYLYLYYHEIENRDYFDWTLPANLYLPAYRNGENVTALSRDQQRVSSDSLFRDIHLPDERKTYVLIDLYSREMQYGIFMCELPYEYFHYFEGICFLVSTAIKIIGLFSTQRNLIDEKETILRKLEQENKHLDNLSNTDLLTGLYNRRGFMGQAEQLLSMQKNNGKSALVLFADLNHLKLINDYYGHDEGDFSIRECAKALREAIGSDGFIGRFGGDEFVAMVKTNNSPQYYKKKLTQYFVDFNAMQQKPYPIGLSVGIHPFTVSSDASIEELLEQADNLLYDDKRNKIPFPIPSTDTTK